MSSRLSDTDLEVSTEANTSVNEAALHPDEPPVPSTQAVSAAESLAPLSGWQKFKGFILGAPDQERNNYDIYERNPYVSNAIVAAPPSIAMFCNGLMITVDGVVVGQMAGKTDFAALSYASAFDPLVKTFGNFVAVGAPQVISEALGRGDIAAAERCLGLSVFINLVLAILVMAILVPVAPAFMAFAGAKGVLLDKSLEYVYPLCYGAFFFIVQRAICGCVLAEGRANLSCALTIVVTIANSALGPLLVGPLGLGVSGSAIASLLAVGIGSILAFVCYAAGATTCRLRFRYMIPRTKDDLKLILHICYVGMGDFVGNLANAFVSVVINRISTEILEGDPTFTEDDITGGISAQSAMFRIWNLINETMQGISSQGLIPLVAFAFGRRDGRRMYDVLKANAVITFFLGLFFFVIVQGLAEYIVLIFNDDPDYLKFAPTVLRIGLACVPILSPQFYMVSYAQAVGDGLRSTILSLVCYGVYVPLFFISLGLGTNNIYYADIGLPMNDIVSDFTCFALLSGSVLNYRRHLWPEGEEPPATIEWLQKRAEKELAKKRKKAARHAKGGEVGAAVAELAAVGAGVAVSEVGEEGVFQIVIPQEDDGAPAAALAASANFGPGGRMSLAGVPAAALRASMAGRRSLAVQRASLEKPGPNRLL